MSGKSLHESVRFTLLQRMLRATEYTEHSVDSWDLLQIHHK
jgi:hypothetical protein